MTVISDTRAMTLDDAKALFAEYAQHEKTVERAKAMSEARIVAEKARTEEARLPHEQRMAVIEEILTTFIRANAEKYFTKPRKVATDFGRFGLEFCAKVELTDNAAIVQHAKDNGHDELFRVKETALRGAVLKRLRRGEHVPGAKLLEGDVVVLTVDKAYKEGEG